jgi:hypothetical protein
MSSFKNPTVPLITNPVNIDRPIQEIQIALSSLGWLDKVFGRAWLAYKSSHGKRGAPPAKQYPHVWQGLNEDGSNKDLLEVLPNDNLKSQCFFKVEDPINLVEFVPNGDSVFRAVTSIIFWFDLKKIDPTIDYPFVELLKGQVMRKLSNMTFAPSSNLNVLRIWEGAANVFRGYDISELKDQELVYPRGGFRFECDLFYREDCPYDAYNVPQGLTVDSTLVSTDSINETSDMT